MFKNIFNRNALFWTLSKIKNRIPSLILLTSLSVLDGFLGVMFALGTKWVIDSATQKEPSSLIQSSLMLCLLILGMILCSAFSRHLSDKLDADLDRDLKKTFMHYILHGDYAKLSEFHSGDLVHRLNADIKTISNTILVIFPNFASLIIRTISVVGVLSSFSPAFTIALLTLSIFVGLGMLSLQRLIKNLNKQINDSSGRISGFLQENIEKLLIVQALNIANQVEARHEELLEKRWQLQKRRKNLGILTTTGLSFLGYLIGFVTLIWCAFQMMQGNMTFGTLTATTQLASQLEYPIYSLPHILRQLINMSASAERLMEIEAIKQNENSYRIDVPAVYDNLMEISAHDLCFGYDHSLIFDHVEFHIPKNKLTVIIGTSGIGKSTLLKLLLGIYEPSSGYIALEGTQTSSTIVSNQTRQLFSYAPQGNLIFSGTLRENLIVVRPQATEDEIMQAVYVSAIDDYITQLSNGLDTRLGENGIGLSEGQVQRLSLARAILSQSPILLLDEVTSSLDTETEQKVLRRILELKNRTCIAVTHRPAILEMADYVMELGPNQINCSTVIH